MAIVLIYATLIMERDKQFSQVPTRIKPDVKRQLEVFGVPELAQ